MDVEFDTFLVGLYTHVDDLYRAHFADEKPVRPGATAGMSDSEVLTLLVLGQALGVTERALVRRAAAAWRAYFPRLLSQSAFNRRARDLAGVLVRLIALLGAELGSATATYQVLDGVPVPLLRRCRGERHRLFGAEAAIGRGGSDRDWYYGCELLLAATDAGAVTGFVLGPANTDDRWFADALLCWRDEPLAVPWTAADLPPSHRRGGGHVGPTGPLWPRAGAGLPSAAPYLGDGAFGGAVWTPHWRDDYGALVLRGRDLAPARDAPVRRPFAGWRQVIETVNGQLACVLGRAFPGAKTRWGLLTRIAAKLVTFNLGLWLNRHFGRPPFALASLFGR
jgi:hypothetical protein